MQACTRRPVNHNAIVSGHAWTHVTFKVVMHAAGDHCETFHGVPPTHLNYDWLTQVTQPFLQQE